MKIIGISAAAVAFLWLTTSPAYAYLDPGTGSIILQAILGTIAVIGVSAKIYWYKLKSLFGWGKTAHTSKDHSE